MNAPIFIKKSIQSEKAYQQIEKGVYTFLVARQAQKAQIKNAIEKQFSVKVRRVNVISKPAKTKRVGKTRKLISVGGAKKAIVYLEPGQNIAMFSPKATTKSKSTKKDK